MQLFVRLAGLDGHRTVAVDVACGCSVAALRLAIAATVRAPAGALDCLSLLSGSGRPLGDGDACAAAAGVVCGSTLTLAPRLCGGGGDGGATGAESRSSYLEVFKASAAQAGALDAREELLAVWTTCRLTRQPLGGLCGTRPVCCDQLGYLYDREAVLTALAEAATGGPPLPSALAHASLRGLTTLRLTPLPPGGGAACGGEAASAGVRFCCPVTGLPLAGRARFLALRPSGLVVSDRALRSAPQAVADLLGGGGGGGGEGAGCEAASALASAAAVAAALASPLPLNGTPEEVEALRTALDAAAAKKAAKRKVRAGAGEEASAPAAAAAAVAAAAAAASRLTGATDVAKATAVASAKRFRAADHPPPGATPGVYASLFTSATAQHRADTFGARALSFRR